MKKQLKIASIQTDLVWEDKLKNVNAITEKIRSVEGDSDIIVLPEMFTTGFSMKPEKFAERMSGDTLMWLSVMAQEKKMVICGTLILKEANHYYNRFVWVRPSGEISTYDKKHLFSLGKENEHYAAGHQQTIIEHVGWKIRPAICYDLRFPSWLRNKVANEVYEYDLLIIPANWPEKRSNAWTTLLQARAIENQAYVIGVNRVGIDGNGIAHSGNSLSCDAVGRVQYHSVNEEKIDYGVYDYELLYSVRKQMPFLKDDV